ncbi:hypothetical protein NVP1031O_178 [Vibrio phage 1.031.O._10N.261.46.F8]|nr:hypothetical protein NVP1031O_178 [Vibrio phage 1.031.O._10N.261.46.F8]
MSKKLITGQDLLQICESAGSLYVANSQLTDADATPYAGGPKNWVYDDEGHRVHVKPDGTRIDLTTGDILPTEAERLEATRHDRLPPQKSDNPLSKY